VDSALFGSTGLGFLSDQEDKVAWKEDYNLLKKPNCGNFCNGESFCPQQNAIESCGGAFAKDC
jgi:hypothetical protein